MEEEANAGTIVLGGLFTGGWLALLVYFDGHQPWLWWGLVGLALGGAVYGARVAEPGVRRVLLIVIGVLSGFLLTLSIIRVEEEALAALLTFLGAGLMAVAIPSPRRSFTHDEPTQGHEGYQERAR